MENLINKVDHILVQSNYVKEIFNVLTEILDLPIVWDIKNFKDTFISGGVCFGNVNIEILNYSTVLRKHKIVPDKEGIIGVAFEPINSIEKIVMELNGEGVKHGGIEPFKEYIHGKSKTLWTNLFLEDLLEGSQIFFCKYEIDIQKRRQRVANILKNRDGGKIKLERVDEIVIGYSKEETLKQWEKISIGKEKFIKRFEDGPKVKFIESEKDEILSILLKVESIDYAKKVLVDNKYILINEENELIFKVGEPQNLGFKLCE
ncbi:hypothetical protein [uncultured Clostridium sp.]|uniref:hypothetical protein n=1 Tax=uncultured Clostridium sp. TaxID=59620 RepID=UPI0026016C33|nr:hypothetical protein [uncultured Clostridium sp.]